MRWWWGPLCTRPTCLVDNNGSEDAMCTLYIEQDKC